MLKENYPFHHTLPSLTSCYFLAKQHNTASHCIHICKSVNAISCNKQWQEIPKLMVTVELHDLWIHTQTKRTKGMWREHIYIKQKRRNFKQHEISNLEWWKCNYEKWSEGQNSHYLSANGLMVLFKVSVMKVCKDGLQALWIGVKSPST